MKKRTRNIFRDQNSERANEIKEDFISTILPNFIEKEEVYINKNNFFEIEKVDLYNLQGVR